MDMKSSRLLKFDAKLLAERIQDFVSESYRSTGRSGLVVPVSGGLDSSVVATLCVRALGKELVKGLLLPEQGGNPQASHFAGILAEWLGIETETIDITKILKAVGTYSYPLYRIPTRRLKKYAVRSHEMAADGENNYLKFLEGTARPLIQKGMASFYSKQRVRLVVTYRYAEEHNLLVVGSAHKSEDLLGLFVKFGIDDGADLMPLKPLYRTQILLLAKELGLPEKIVGRTPNPDLIPGVADKYYDVLGIPSDQVDQVLYGIERGLAAEQIHEESGIAMEAIDLLLRFYRGSSLMRTPSLAPDLEDLLR
jgi:NAD+ synthase